MKRAIHKLTWAFAKLLLFSLLAGLLAASLVRFAPGFGVDERELNSQLSRESVEAIRSTHRLNSGLLSYYARYLRGAAHGDFGISDSLQQPVSSLIWARLPITARSVLFGVLLAWVGGLIAALAGIRFKGMAAELAGTLVAGFLIALPSAVVAVFSVYLRAPVFLAIAVVIFPKLFRYLRSLLERAYVQPYVLAAQARGIGRWRIIFHHVFPLASPGIVALLGVSVSLAFGAAIPIEALCDSPGIGQLAWQATLNRDLPLIMNLALLATVITVAANSLASIANETPL
jgi:ABC-type dipeptide/oligopeptide/nickel transport system permease component